MSSKHLVDNCIWHLELLKVSGVTLLTNPTQVFNSSLLKAIRANNHRNVELTQSIFVCRIWLLDTLQHKVSIIFPWQSYLESFLIIRCCQPKAFPINVRLQKAVSSAVYYLISARLEATLSLSCVIFNATQNFFSFSLAVQHFKIKILFMLDGEFVWHIRKYEPVVELVVSIHKLAKCRGTANG